MNYYIKKNKGLFFCTIVCAIISTIFAVLAQFLKGDVLDYAITGKSDATFFYGVLLIVFILLEIGFFYIHNRLTAMYVTKCHKDLRADLFHSILKRSYVKFKQQSQGEYIAKYTNDVDMIVNMYFSTWTLFIQILIKVVFVSVALFLLDVRVAVLTLFLLTTPLYVPKLVEGKLVKASKDYVKAMEDHLSIITDWLSGFEIIKNFSSEKKVKEYFTISNNKTMDAKLISKQLGNLTRLVSTLISYISYFIILAFSAYLCLKGDFSAGDFFVAIGMIDQLSYPLISLSELIQNLLGIKPICNEMKLLIGDRNDTIISSSNNQVLMDKEIVFRDVSFSYEKGKDLLKDFSMKMKEGKFYLLKGPSGCGKTTVTNLLLKYYEADGGSISIGDIPLSNISNIYDYITVVRQDAVLFLDTLRNNLTMYQDYKDDVLIGQLKRLGLDKYANGEGLDMVITEDGSNLSGGERKRVCLARALLRESNVIILDEPLANLDDATALSIENEIFQIRDKTVLVVSHQFSKENIRRFDSIIEM